MILLIFYFILFILLFYFSYYLRIIFLFFNFILFLIFYLLMLNLNFMSANYEYNLIIYNLNFLNLSYILTFDIFSLFLILLTLLLSIISILIIWNLKYKLKELLILLFLLNFFLINTFCITNIFFFYIYFEALIIPLFLLIGIWGSRERKIVAAYQFFIYTFLGSLFMLISIFFLYSHLGSLNIKNLNLFSITFERQLFFWIVFFISIAIKIPLLPVHIWLPEAHVEAPTIGSIILAGIILKLGFFALIKFLFPIFPWASLIFSPIIILISLISVIYSSLSTIIQIDIKKMIAYSSIAHMSFVLLGLFSFTFQGIVGGIILMLSHGLTSSGLFISVGILYERYKTRLFLYYGGMVRLMPIFSILFFIIILSNMSFPGTLNFVAEFSIFFGIIINNYFICFLASLSMILSATYSLSLYNHIIYGSLKIQLIKKFSDLSNREFFILSILVFLIIFFGIFSNFFFFSLESIISIYIDNIIFFLFKIK